MSITITPNISSVTAPSVPAAGILLQPGQVITAQVVQVLGSNQVQISIGGQTIEAATQVPLQAGQTLQLQVSQTSDGIGLAIVNSPSGTTANQGGATTIAASNAVALSPTLAASLAANLTAEAVTPGNALSQLETLAVSIAAQSAATQQTSLALLFADLNAASALPNLPPQVHQAVAQVLAQQTNLDQNLTAQAVKEAFQSSGLFLEASLASGSPLSSNGVPDLKAALIVLRQALTTSLSDVTATTVTDAPASVPQPGATLAAPSVAALPTGASTSGTTSPLAAAAVTAAPGTIPVILAEEGALAPSGLTVTILAEDAQAAISIAPQADLPVSLPAAPPVATPNAASTLAPEILDLVASNPAAATSAATTDTAARAAASSAALNLLQEAFQAAPVTASGVSSLVLENSQLLSLLPVVAGVRLQTTDEAEFARTNLPPPPLSGALPSAQPVAPATLSPHLPMQTILQHLLSDTDGALARQTLLQVASLPGQADPAAGRGDAATLRWNFEIPFATPQGTAMAQFEISRDGGGREANAAKQTWRARFSLDVEPAGPVHALISLSGERTSVRMWAERPATAAQLRDGVAQLSQALSRAELVPGDITVRDGAPTQPPVTSAGHFLDRAL